MDAVFTDSFVLELEPMHSGGQRRPRHAQARRKLSQFGVSGMQRRQVIDPERMFFHRQKMQAAAGARFVAPRHPRGQKIEALAEPGLEDREARACLPAAGQVIARQEHVLGLGDAAGTWVIDIAVGLRPRRALRVERKNGRLDFGGMGRHRRGRWNACDGESGLALSTSGLQTSSA